MKTFTHSFFLKKSVKTRNRFFWGVPGGCPGPPDWSPWSEGGGLDPPPPLWGVVQTTLQTHLFSHQHCQLALSPSLPLDRPAHTGTHPWRGDGTRAAPSPAAAAAAPLSSAERPDECAEETLKGGEAGAQGWVGGQVGSSCVLATSGGGDSTGSCPVLIPRRLRHCTQTLGLWW